MSVVTDQELDRVISLRISRNIPLPPELCLCDRSESRRLHAWMAYYRMYGLDQHPLVRLASAQKVDSAIAASVSRSAPYLDKISHYAAWLGEAQPVSVSDSRSTDPAHPTGDAVAVGPTAHPGREQSPSQIGRPAAQRTQCTGADGRLPPCRSASGGTV